MSGNPARHHSIETTPDEHDDVSDDAPLPGQTGQRVSPTTRSLRDVLDVRDHVDQPDGSAALILEARPSSRPEIDPATPGNGFLTRLTGRLMRFCLVPAVPPGPTQAGASQPWLATHLATRANARGPLLERKGPLTCYFVVAGAGVEPATSGL